MRHVLCMGALVALILAGGCDGGGGASSAGAGGEGGAGGQADCSPDNVWQGDGRSVYIEAECAHGADVGDCNGCISGSQLGTMLENADTTTGFFDGGDYLMYRSIDLTGLNTLRMRYATQNTGEVRISIDAVDGTKIASWPPEPTGGWTNFTDTTVPIQPVTGTHDLYLVGVGTTEGIVNLDYLIAGVCQPNCSGKSCGPDGCGGECGTCSGQDFCTAAGQCEPCVPDCAGKACGDDTCGGTCGDCGAGEVCTAARTCEQYSTLGGPPRVHVEGATIKDPQGQTQILRGVSLIDIGAQHVWRTSGVAGMIDRLTDTGWNTRIVRFPIYISAQPYPFSLTDPIARERYMTELLRPAVDYATKKGLYVIIDFHEIADITDREDARTQTFWRYMARQFADYPNVIYEVFNEPIRVGDACELADSCWPAFKERADRWVSLIREAAPSTLVLVGGPSWSQVIGPAATNPIADTNVAYVGHIYPFHVSSGFVEREIRACAAVHPVILTEWGYGFDTANPAADKAPYVDIVKAMADEFGMGYTAWVADYEWGPPMFTDAAGTTLSDFGQFARDWLAAGPP
ncbi:MAG: cellulase family glycosylhydrolase [Myxococcota bacterium]